MASFEEAMKDRLGTDAAIVALVGSRSYAEVLPSDGSTPLTYPALTWQVLDRREEPTFVDRSRVFPVSVQVDVWAQAGSDRRAVAAALRTSLLTWSGSWGGVVVHRAFKDTDFDSTEDWGDGGPRPVYRTTTRWTVWITEP